MFWSRSFITVVVLLGTMHMKLCPDSDVIRFCETRSLTRRQVFIEFSQQILNLTTCECNLSLARIRPNQERNDVIEMSFLNGSIMAQAGLQVVYHPKHIKVITPANGTRQLKLYPPEDNRTVPMQLSDTLHNDDEACLRIKGVEQNTIVRVSCRETTISPLQEPREAHKNNHSSSTRVPNNQDKINTDDNSTNKNDIKDYGILNTNDQLLTTTNQTLAPHQLTSMSSTTPPPPPPPLTTTATTSSPPTTATTTSSSLPTKGTITERTDSSTASPVKTVHTQHDGSTTARHSISSDSDESTSLSQTSTIFLISTRTAVSAEVFTETTMSMSSDTSVTATSVNSYDEWNFHRLRLPWIIGALAAFSVILTATIVAIVFHRRRQGYMYVVTSRMETPPSAVSASSRYQQQATVGDLADAGRYAETKGSDAVMMKNLRDTEHKTTLHYDYTCITLPFLASGRECWAGSEPDRAVMDVQDGTRYPGCVQILPQDGTGEYAFITEEELKTSLHLASGSGSPRPTQEQHYRNCAPALPRGNNNPDASLNTLPSDRDNGIVKFNRYNNALYSKHPVYEKQMTEVSSQQTSGQVEPLCKTIALDLTMNGGPTYDRACHSPLIKPKLAVVDSKTYSKLKL